jgi:hypothetical protein
VGVGRVGGGTLGLMIPLGVISFRVPPVGGWAPTPPPDFVRFPGGGRRGRASGGPVGGCRCGRVGVDPVIVVKCRRAYGQVSSGCQLRA